MVTLPISPPCVQPDPSPGSPRPCSLVFPSSPPRPHPHDAMHSCSVSPVVRASPHHFTEPFTRRLVPGTHSSQTRVLNLVSSLTPPPALTAHSLGEAMSRPGPTSFPWWPGARPCWRHSLLHHLPRLSTSILAHPPLTPTLRTPPPLLWLPTRPSGTPLLDPGRPDFLAFFQHPWRRWPPLHFPTQTCCYAEDTAPRYSIPHSSLGSPGISVPSLLLRATDIQLTGPQSHPAHCPSLRPKPHPLLTRLRRSAVASTLVQCLRPEPEPTRALYRDSLLTLESVCQRHGMGMLVGYPVGECS